VKAETNLWRRRSTTALAVVGVGAIVSLTGGTGGVFAELPAFVFVSVCAYFFVSRAGAIALVVVMAVLSILTNHDVSSSAGPTGREIGFGLVFMLLSAIAVLGVVLDIVLRVASRSARS
jgi:uncharacterized membrane protein